MTFFGEATVDNPFVVFAAKNIVKDSGKERVEEYFNVPGGVEQLVQWVVENFALFNNNFYAETGARTLLKDIPKTAQVIVERLRKDLEMVNER